MYLNKITLEALSGKIKINYLKKLNAAKNQLKI